MKKISAVIAVVLLFLAASLTAQERVKNLDLSADGIRFLDVDSGSGFLKIKGVKGLKKIEVRAEIILRGFDDEEIDEVIKDQVELKLQRRGRRALLTANVDYQRRSFFRSSRNRHIKIDLTVRVPYEMDLNIDDGSGDMTIEEINGSLNIDDGSGEMDISGIVGDVEIDDGSGDLYLENIVGSLRIDDGSGDLVIRDVKGDVDIDDNSGSIHIRDISGSVTVSDGSGSIDITGVGEDVVIRENRSGSVDLHDVRGRVRRRDR